MPDPVLHITGGFRFDPRRRALEKDGEPVPLPARAAQLLAILLAERHRTVPNAELITRAWDDVSVSENNLHQAITTLRRAFGDARESPRYIATVPKAGYQFIAEVSMPQPVQPQRLRKAAVAGLLLSLASFAAYYAAHRRVTVAVPDFTNLQPPAHGGHEHAWLAASLRDFARAAASPGLTIQDDSSYRLTGDYSIPGPGRIRLRVGVTGESPREAEGPLESFAALTALLVRQAAALPEARNAADSLAAGVRAWQAADAPRALLELRKAVAAEPDNALALSNLGYVLGETGRFAESKLLHRRAVALTDELLVRARHRASEGDWPKAIELYKRVWAAQPDDATLTLEFVSAQFGARSAAAARDTLTAAQRTIPGLATDPRTLWLAARIHGQFAEMEAVRTQALAAAKTAQDRGMSWVQAKATLLAAGATQNLGHAAEAANLRRQARQACEQLPDDVCVAASWRIEGNLDLNAGRVPSAMEAYQRALRLARRSGAGLERLHVLNGIGVALLRGRQFDEAEAIYRESLAEDLTSYRVDAGGGHTGLAEALLGQGRYREAAEHALRAAAIARSAQDPVTRANASRILSALRTRNE